MAIGREIEPVRKDIDCDSCTAACCRAGMQMIMTSSEVLMNSLRIRRKVEIPAQSEPQFVAFRNRETGEITEKIIPPDTEVSRLQVDCGNLTPDNRCGIFDSPYRPQACINFEPGSEACMYSREQAGIIDSPSS